MLMMQLRTETLAFVDDRDGALDALAAANESLLLDIGWLDRCPLLGALREDPRFALARTGVAARAELVSSELSRRMI
jgi:hypothetical protein